ncbi:Acyl-CoA reductase (LuxC) [Marinomonas spartinae]|uniref:acyl-CoA reductase n=1 Tax=Marinomonas spartinae TaxID=1792290 RepID=UPI00080907EC|nr:acyl-CoA reductase [Marinomonas spartinae]SBS40439.1 Acyl-CoA reductase (LuxC) [Marinomonas spartinae]
MQYDNESNFEHYFDGNDIFSTPVNVAYNDKLVDFLSSLSKSILKDKVAREYPDLITFAYFCRKSNLVNFKENYFDINLSNRFGLGVCLHIAPANIPMNFAFSFAMGLISGNKNIVRLPSKNFEQIGLFLKHFKNVASDASYSEIERSNFFVRTQRNSEKLLSLVSKVDCMVVWGGDVTVASFRNLVKKPSCVEVYFPDRVSSLLIDCDYFIKQDERALKAFCSDLYNDTYLVDQNACSSASMILWYSKNNNFELAKNKLNESLVSFLDYKYKLETISRIEKDIDIMRYCYSVNSSLQLDKLHDKLWYIDTPSYKLIKPKLGTFITKNIDDLASLSTIFRDNEQTLTYFGFSEGENKELFESISYPMLDRIVPVGQALDIGFIWDGKNMIYSLSKCVDRK